ncbi:jg11353 [Pararge aegeria aegeria]|uniref:Jg11353 protein n=1 Tax=Pararge aegeria aegeria TaxID=348720 RepID=A0A8S4RMB3_9NEOP|nr:jg11353 [Pararge aegeria aegeria]
MSGKKLSSEEVPQKFIEWVLAMGCPGEKIPSIEKMTGMCRSQYYMSWRSLMERVQAKDLISQKRLTVFYDDVKLCQEKKLLNEATSNDVLPEQLSLWKEHTEVKEMVVEAEGRVNKARITLNELMDKVSCKVIQRNTSRQHIEDLQRRSWLLSQVSNELTSKLANLEETRTIADSLCNVEKEQHDVQIKLDKCIAQLQRKSQPRLPLSTPVASSSIVSNHENETAGSEKDDHVLSLVNCRGDVLWPHLYDKLTSLYSRLSEKYKNHIDVGNNRSLHSMLAYTAALQSTLALEAMKNRAHFRKTHEQLAASIEDLNTYVTEDAFELLVVQVQRAYCEARVKSLKASLEDLTARQGPFDCGGDSHSTVDAQATLGKIANINKCIVKSRDELKRLISSSASTERKIYNIRECLLAVFNALHNNTDIRDNAFSRGVQLDFPTESISLLRQFYKKRCERDANVNNLSFNLEMSDRSFVDDSDNPTFVDELNVYLKKFNLEKNRKLVLDSGEKVWIFETLQALSSRLQTRWVADDVTVLLCPSVRPSRALQRLCDTQQQHALSMLLQRTVHRIPDDILKSNIADITTIRNLEADAVDKLKKRITENLNLLQKIHRNLEVCEENLQFWSGHRLKKFISPNRTVGGQTYVKYEASYTEMLNW